jgi:xylitol oxidase
MGQVTAELAGRGLALRALASLPHISLAGACATGTHGSGDTTHGLASAVRAVDLVQADGSAVTLRRGDPDFPAAVVSLGALGVATSMTLDAEPAFDVRQDVYDDVAVGPAGDELLDAFGDAYSVSLFTVLDSERFTLGWLKHRVPDGGSLPPPAPTWRGGVLATSPRHPVPGQPPEATTTQGVVGPWHERLPHFRPDAPPSSQGAELQSEFLLPRAAAPAAWREVLRIRARLAPYVQTVELRSIAADVEWLSPTSGRDTIGFHATWVPDADAVRGALSVLEPVLAPFDARPHWGKVFVTPVEQVAARYPSRDAFAEVVRRRDPDGRFRNAFVDRVVS